LLCHEPAKLQALRDWQDAAPRLKIVLSSFRVRVFATREVAASMALARDRSQALARTERD
jgi:hypothetical protein